MIILTIGGLNGKFFIGEKVYKIRFSSTLPTKDSHFILLYIKSIL